MTQLRPCGCNSYSAQHNSWCEDTPIFANMVKAWGGNPFEEWPFVVFALISPIQLTKNK